MTIAPRPRTDLPESVELELAAALLEAVVPADLDRLIARLRQAAVVGTPTAGRPPDAVAPFVRRAAAEALRAIRTARGPRGALGRGFRASPSVLFGLELEGLSAEDQAFEIARQLVRFGVVAYRLAGRPRRRGGRWTAHAAVLAAARRYAPGIGRRLSPMGTGPPSGRRGTWRRQGRTIVVLGA